MWQLINEADQPKQGPLEGQFAKLEALTRQENGAPSLYLWRHQGGLALGLQDSRLPGVQAATKPFTSQGLAVATRTCGGRLVPLTPGVLNLALIYEHQGEPIEAGFERLWGLLAQALARLGLRAERGEVAGSFCPGRHDLSVGGRKVAGLAQRRLRLTSRVEAFLIWDGSGAQLAQLAAEFYRRVGGPLSIEPGVMASLAEVAPAPPTLGEVIEAIGKSMPT